jgi:hypothetical protein
MFCSDELIETPYRDWSDYQCDNCLCSYEGEKTIYFDFNSNLELSIPSLDGRLIDNYPINIQVIKDIAIVYNNWILNIHQYIEGIKISSAEEVKDLVKRLHNLKLFI